MGNFDVTTPAGSDLLSQGDDRIREFKLAMREALRAGEVAGDNIEGVEAIFPGSSPSTAPVYRYRGLKGTTAERPTAGQYGLYYDTDRKVLQRDNGTSWEDIGQMVVDGSITEAKLSTSVAGAGLSGGANTPLSVNVGTGIEISSDAVRISAAAAGNGLSGGSGSALSVNVDNSTIEVNSDSLRVKANGIGGSSLKLLTQSPSNITLTINTLGQPTSSITINNALVLGVKATVSSGTAYYYSAAISWDNNPTSISYSHDGSSSVSLNTGQPKSVVTFSIYGVQDGDTVTFSSIVIYYMELPTISY